VVSSSQIQNCGPEHHPSTEALQVAVTGHMDSGHIKSDRNPTKSYSWKFSFITMHFLGVWRSPNIFFISPDDSVFETHDDKVRNRTISVFPMSEPRDKITYLCDLSSIRSESIRPSLPHVCTLHICLAATKIWSLLFRAIQRNDIKRDTPETADFQIIFRAPTKSLK